MSDSTPPSTVTRNNGPKVVIAMVLMGIILAYTLHLLMPRTNPKIAEPGSPYYSAPTTEELQAQRRAAEQGKP